MSLKQVGWPSSLIWFGLTTYQVRATNGSISRCASLSRASSVFFVTHALPYGLSGPGGSAAASTS